MSKKILLSFALVASLVVINACGGKEEKKEDEKKTEETEGNEASEETAEVAETPVIECGEPMNGFMAMMKGSYTDVEAALTQYGAEGLERNDMDIYDLQEPVVVACTKSETGECCTIEAKAGMTIRTYDICWEGDKIVSVTDKGVR